MMLSRGVHVRVGIAKFVDHGDDDLAGALLQRVVQVFDAVGRFDIGDVGGVEGAGDIGVETRCDRRAPARWDS